MFSKKEYWKNREDGKRGQGAPFNPVIGPVATIGGKPVSKKATLKNTKRARKAVQNG